MNRFKNHDMRKTYDALMSLARDDKSELYVTPGGARIIDKQGRNRRSGASHRNAFWAGFDGIAPAWLERRSLNYAAFRAGEDFAKEKAEAFDRATFERGRREVYLDSTSGQIETDNGLELTIEQARELYYGGEFSDYSVSFWALATDFDFDLDAFLEDRREHGHD